MGAVKTVKERNKELEGRLTEFSKELIGLLAKLPRTSANLVLRNQAIRAGISIGANYIEACEAISSRDLIHRIAVCRKEARETGYWLGLIAHSNLSLAKDVTVLWKESEEYLKISNIIISKFKQ